MKDESKIPQDDKYWEFKDVANRLFGIEKQLGYIKICFIVWIIISVIQIVHYWQ